jgi:hypothetical protein
MGSLVPNSPSKRPRRFQDARRVELLVFGFPPGNTTFFAKRLELGGESWGSLWIQTRMLAWSQTPFITHLPGPLFFLFASMPPEAAILNSKLASGAELHGSCSVDKQGVAIGRRAPCRLAGRQRAPWLPASQGQGFPINLAECRGIGRIGTR